MSIFNEPPLRARKLKIFYCIEISVYYGDFGCYVRFLDFKFLHVVDISYSFGNARQNPHLKYLVSFTGYDELGNLLILTQC